MMDELWTQLCQYLISTLVLYDRNSQSTAAQSTTSNKKEHRTQMFSYSSEEKGQLDLNNFFLNGLVFPQQAYDEKHD